MSRYDYKEQPVINNETAENKGDKEANVYRWSDIETSANTLPAYTEEALNQIVVQLGYLPKRQITLPYEPFIRAALLSYDQHSDIDRLYDECKPYIRQICMKDMEPHKLVKYEADIYEAYETYLPEYQDKARSRIVRFLGREPKLENSVKAELIMREKIADDRIFLGDERTIHDSEVLTIIEYREWLSITPIL